MIAQDREKNPADWSLRSAAPGLNVFSDTECVNYATKTIKAPNAYSYIGKRGANTCIVLENLSGTWGSVRQAET